MLANGKKAAVSKFPLRLMSSVRRGAERFSQREGVSLNQFINVAVAEKLAHLQHDEWLASRPKPTRRRIARALAILDRPTRSSPAPDDAVPKGYSSIQRAAGYPRAAGRK
jgi:hypothetical protein